MFLGGHAITWAGQLHPELTLHNPNTFNASALYLFDVGHNFMLR